MKKIYTLVFTFLFSIVHFAQSISVTGNIKDVQTNSPIENAKVQIKNISNGIIDSVFSDAIGNWQYDIATSVEDDIYYLPTNLEVMQNFPNPFNPLTRINYELQIANYVTLSVYDINGRLVKELVNQKQSAGSYEVNFDGSGLPSGTYIYRLQAGDFSETKKMVLLK